MAEEFNEKLNSFVDKASKMIQDGSKNVISMLDKEKNKAEIRAEIGHNARDLSKAYEQLGREYCAALAANKTFVPKESAMELIRSKEKVIELLNEKLDKLEEK
ncbi:MAG: hypothetical protein IKG15_11105 [Solobacterium sp.]|jgi:hypothetical protein|nr:hypothetical protein [Solobacterium sp.]